METKFNINDYPTALKAVNEQVAAFRKMFFPDDDSKETWKKCWKAVYSMMCSKEFCQKLDDSVQTLRTAYQSHVNGNPIEKPVHQESEREVMLHKWERFVLYTTESAKKNGKLKQSENPNAYQWLKNNDLLGFSCCTDIASLPDKFKKLIVYAAKNGFDGVKLVKNKETGKYSVNMEYLEYICAGIEPLF